MRASQFLIKTLKEAPQEALVDSHRLMIRAGMIRKLASGVYSWLPLGLRVLRKVESIIRDQMDQMGAQEILMPILQPSELWAQSGRSEIYGDLLFRLHDRHEHQFFLGPTHEEIITSLVKQDINSYKALPLMLYQIQTKLRDETRPRSGVIRAREFLMKDAYSFHMTADCLKRTYIQMQTAYRSIFDSIGLDYRMIAADVGEIGGELSHEFHALSEIGEDQVQLDQSTTHNSIEIGHIFQIGQRYSQSAQFSILDKTGKQQWPYMACYGIGISRMVATSIEQNHDARGIRWHDTIAPFLVWILVISKQHSDPMMQWIESIYQQLKSAQCDPFLDDRKQQSFGAKSADADLIGIPHRIVLSDTGYKKQLIEYKHRGSTETRFYTIEELIQYLKSL